MDSLRDAAMTTVRPRWYRLTPDRLIVGLLAVEAALLVAKWLGLFPKGWAVLTAIAAVGTVLLLMFLWFLAALLFRCRFQYSLRSLMLVAVAVAIPCSWLATEARERRSKITLRTLLGIWGSWATMVGNIGERLQTSRQGPHGGGDCLATTSSAMLSTSASTATTSPTTT